MESKVLILVDSENPGMNYSAVVNGINSSSAESGVISTDIPIVRARMPELDFVRGVAVLMVLFYHGLFWSNGLQGLTGLTRSLVDLTRFGWLGVNLFFVLSGFLITGILLDSKSDVHYFRRFYIRRALRILPALYALLLLLILTRYPGRTYLLLSFLYLSNLTPLWGVAMTYPMLWSLAVEEHFYLVWPAVVRKLSFNALAKTVALIVVAEPIARAVSFSIGCYGGLSTYTWLISDGLASGAALALYVRSPRFSRKWLTFISCGLVGLTGLMLSIGGPYGVMTRERILGASLQLTSANFLFAGLLGMTLLVGTSRYSFLVRMSGFRFFGDISYGLYLVHWIAFYCFDAIARVNWPGLYPARGRVNLMVIRFIIASTAGISVAALSRRYFEEPFLRLKDRFAA